MAEVLADDGGPGDEHVEDHENEEDDEKTFADPDGDFFDEVGENWVDDFDENESEQTPESHDGDGGAAAEVHGIRGIVP